jgi:hypothetical protein
MPEIGATLREARMRARIDVSEIEAQTKIRAKYLRALENEEWGLLPGPTFVKSFLRTYAQALGLDGKALVEEYRLHHEGPGESFEPIATAPRRTRTGRPPRPRGGGDGPSRRYIAAVTVAGAVVVLLIVLLATSGGGSSPSNNASTHHTTTSHKTGSSHTTTTPHRAPVRLVALSLTPTAVVYACLVGDGGHVLIPGLELQPGQSTPTYHAHRFLLTLGNSSVTMFIDGTARTVAPSSEAIGYAITRARGRQPLTSAQMPTCR